MIDVWFLIRVCGLAVLGVLALVLVVQKLSQTYFKEKEKHLRRVLNLAEKGE